MPKYNVARLRQFFFEAALATYVSGKKAERLTDRPWAKQFMYYGEGKFSGLLYMDEYVTNGEWSGGSTVILSAEDIAHPIWLMQYHGWCRNDDPEVLAFLKRALTRTYLKGEFCGGRGLFPGLWGGSDGELVYENMPQMPPYRPQDFTDFQGRERVWRQPDSTKDIFWHRYQGILLGEAE